MRHSRLASSDKKGTMERKANVSRRRRLAVGAAVLAVLVVRTVSVVAASTPASLMVGSTVTKATNPSSTVPQPTYDKKCQSTASQNWPWTAVSPLKLLSSIANPCPIGGGQLPWSLRGHHHSVEVARVHEV